MSSEVRINGRVHVWVHERDWMFPASHPPTGGTPMSLVYKVEQGPGDARLPLCSLMNHYHQQPMYPVQSTIVTDTAVESAADSVVSRSLGCGGGLGWL